METLTYILVCEILYIRLSEPPMPAGRNAESQTSLMMEEMNPLTGEPLYENVVLNQQGPPDDKEQVRLACHWSIDW